MQPSIVIRSARPNEAARLRELGVTGWETTYSDFLQPENRQAYLSGPFWSAERLRVLTEHKECWVLVAEIDGTVTGFLTLEPHPSGATELTRFYVDPTYRGRGIGQQLWEDARDRLQTRGTGAILVNVFGDNRAGRRFYERLGFTLIEETTTVVGSQTVYDVWYRLALTPGPSPAR
jgi:diamine N-acetyltransferase